MRWTGFHLQTAIRMAAVAAAMMTSGGGRLAAQKPVPTSGLAANTWYFVAWDSATPFPDEPHSYRPFPPCCRLRMPTAAEMTMGDVNGPTGPSPSTYGKALASFHLSISDSNGAWLTVLDTLVPGDIFSLYLDGIFQGYSSTVPSFAFENWDYGEVTWNPLTAWGKPELSRGRFLIPPGEHNFMVRTVVPGWPAASGMYGWLRLDNATPPKGK